MKLPLPGTRFGHLEIDREIGRGAFGRVHRAHDTLLDRLVALKVVPVSPGESDPDLHERIRVEARAAGQLSSPNLVQLHAVYPPGEYDAWLFEMEYVEGGSLGDLLSREPTLPPERALEIVHGVARGLREAHRKGVVHGDIKPGNVLLTTDGAPRLADFGLASLLGDATLSAFEVGELVGTPAYIAPERIMGEPPHPGCDLWGLGILLYRMLAGRVPFAVRDLIGLFHSIQNAPPPALPPHVPEGVAELVRALLAKDPESRPSLETILATGVGLAPSAADRPRRSRAPSRGGRPLRGRATALALLDACLTDALREHRRRTVLIRGSAGIGKTALALNATRQARVRGMLTIELRASPLEGLFVPLVRGLQKTLREKVDWAADDEPFGSAMHIVRSLVEEAAPQHWESSHEARWAVERTLLGLARRSGVLLVVDDGANASEEDAALLRHLHRHLEAEGFVLLATIRDGAERNGLDEFAREEGIESIDLAPLTPDETYELLQDHLPGLSWDSAVARRLIELGGGNPLFTLEALQELEESDAIRVEEDRVTAGPAWGDEMLPLHLRDMVVARLGRVTDEEHDLLDIAAADGVEFDAGAVAAVTGETLLSVLRGLQRLYTRRGLILPSGDGFRFINAMTREILYEDLAPPLRKELHHQLAESLEAAQEERTVSPERLAIHWERAGRPGKAEAYARIAALACLRRHEIGRGLEWAGRGGMEPGSITVEDALANRELTRLLVTGHRVGGNLQDSTRVLSVLREAASASGDEELQVYCEYIHLRKIADHAGAGTLDADRLIGIAERAEGDHLKGNILHLACLVLAEHGHWEDARRVLAEAERCQRRANNVSGTATCLAARASIHLRHNELMQAERDFAQAAECYTKGGHRANAAIIQLNRAMCSHRRGELEPAIRVVERSIRALDLEGASVHAADSGLFLSELLIAAGRLQGAREACEYALRVGERLKTDRIVSSAINSLTIVHVLLGDLDEARRCLDSIEKQVRAEAEPRGVFCWLSCRTDLLLCGGDPEAALANARETVESLAAFAQPSLCLETLELMTGQVFLGLPDSILGDLRAMEAAGAFGALGAGETGTKLFDALEAYADPGADSADRLADSARWLRHSEETSSNQEFQLLADLIEVEALFRRDDRPAAAKAARAAALRAREQGRVWNELAHLRRAQDALSRGEARDLLDRLAGQRADEAERARLREFWA